MIYIHVVLKAMIALVVLFILTKLEGSRQMSELSMFDYINGITIGSIAAELAIETDDFLVPLIAMITFGLGAMLLSWLSDKNIILRRLIEGRPYIIYQNGTLIYDNMKKNKIDINELLMMCREAGYFDLSELQSVILESNGKMSFLPKSQYRPTTPKDLGICTESAFLFANVILEGKLMEDNLRKTGRDKNWLLKQMEAQNIKSIEEVFLAICDGNDHCYFFRKENNPHISDVFM